MGVRIRKVDPEEVLLQLVIRLAHLRGWMVHHQRPARTRKGWRTAIQGDKGFPDVVLARNGVVLIPELKSETGKVSPDQQRWLDALGLHARLWRPSSWEEIQEVLQ